MQDLAFVNLVSFLYVHRARRSVSRFEIAEPYQTFEGAQIPCTFPIWGRKASSRSVGTCLSRDAPLRQEYVAVQKEYKRQ